VLNYTKGRLAAAAQVAVTTPKHGLTAMLGGPAAVQHALAAGIVTVEGDAEVLTELLALLDDFEFWFDIVTP
jgi:alkyl sulfatase BDS1-like metallo-beta-lactamase superfamily hydrolase